MLIHLLTLICLLVSPGVGEARASAADPHSFGLTETLKVTHLDLDLALDFNRKVIDGEVILTLEKLSPTNELVLDVREITVKRVFTQDLYGKERRVGFSVSAPDDVLGSSLTIELPGNARRVRVEYQTVPGATALQWLTPEQTAARKGPFLFTQSQAIHARSWIPCIDSPALRMTYKARVRVPKGLSAVMSAQTVAADPEAGIFDFHMTQPVPSYLIALAVGVMESRDISPRVRVYAEPNVVEKAAYEFADTEKMMAAAEKLYGPYRWDRYDMIVLPPSFPFGGMENPRLTFLTPTVLSGDRTLVDLIAHELAHSWSGNLVTNASWGNLWINEGFTVYLERRIMEEVFGPDAAKMNFILGVQGLKATVESYGERHPYTKLEQDLRGVDPDDAFSDVPYEKGALLLHRLEEILGRERLDAFLREYFERYAFRAVDTATVEAALRHGLLEGGKKVEGFHLTEWLYEPGLPDDLPSMKTDAFARVEKELERFKNGVGPGDLDTKGWFTQQWLHFLRNLPRKLGEGRMKALDETFSFTTIGNSEIFFNWAELAIANHYEPAFPAIEAFLCGMGRMKFVGPLYHAMATDPELLPRAQRIYEKARASYHPIGQAPMDELLLKR